MSSVDKHIRVGETPVRLCNYKDVYANNYIHADMDFMPSTARPDEVARFGLRAGDVIITKDSETWNDIGVPALVHETGPELVCGYHLAILRTDRRLLHPAFLFRALQSAPVATQLHLRARGVTRFGLSQDSINSLRLPVPSLAEQKAIVRFLDHADRRIQRYVCVRETLVGLSTPADRAASLIGEYRTRLIADVVTGQRDVREAAAKLPNIDPLEAAQAAV